MLPFDWRRVLIYTHRWLGIAGGVLFLSWFLSGIVMMYAGMPSLTPEERLRRLPVLDLSSARVAPAEAARGAGLSLQRVLVGMLGDRPVYRFSARGQWTTVFADSGEVLESLSAEKALEIARHFAPAHATSVSYDARLTGPDQWTLQSGAFMPLHRIGLDDADDTFLYVSERTGEPVMKTTGSGRRWAYVGAVLHWLYFTPLRRHGAFWSQSVIWLSIVGCVLCLSGLVWGVWRLSPSRRYRLKGVHAHSPYASLMKWHHYAGLVFGLVTFTWVFSGGLSMDPWSWRPSTSPTREQREAVSGGGAPVGCGDGGGAARGGGRDRVIFRAEGARGRAVSGRAVSARPSTRSSWAGQRTRSLGADRASPGLSGCARARSLHAVRR